MLLLESAALVLILSPQAPKQLASSVVTGDDSAQARVPNASNKNLSGGEETRRQQFCAYAFTNLIDDDLNQKLTKHSQKTLDTGRLHGGGGGEYLCKNLGVEAGGGRLLEGGPNFGSLRYEYAYVM